MWWQYGKWKVKLARLTAIPERDPIHRSGLCLSPS
jgi:hypothetical protein